MKTEIEILKPCPLCNSIEKLMLYNEYMPLSKTNLGVIECTNNFCPMIVRAPTIEEAVKKWNERPREDFLIKQIDIEKESHKQTNELYVLALDEIIVLQEQLIEVETMYEKADKHNMGIKDYCETAYDELMDMIYDMKVKIDAIRKKDDERRRKSTYNS